LKKKQAVAWMDPPTVQGNRGAPTCTGGGLFMGQERTGLKGGARKGQKTFSGNRISPKSRSNLSRW